MQINVSGEKKIWNEFGKRFETVLTTHRKYQIVVRTPGKSEMDLLCEELTGLTPVEYQKKFKRAWNV